MSDRVLYDVGELKIDRVWQVYMYNIPPSKTGYRLSTVVKAFGFSTLKRLIRRGLVKYSKPVCAVDMDVLTRWSGHAIIPFDYENNIKYVTATTKGDNPRTLTKLCLFFRRTDALRWVNTWDKRVL